jgi:hypothetical protein
MCNTDKILIYQLFNGIDEIWLQRRLVMGEEDFTLSKGLRQALRKP